MAQVVSAKKSYPVAPQRFVTITVTHTGVTSSVLTKADHGLGNISTVFANNRTTQIAGTTMLVKPNTNASGAAQGSVYTTGVVSGDVVDYLIIGN